MLLASSVPERDHDLVARDEADGVSPQTSWQHARTGRVAGGDPDLNLETATDNDVSSYLKQKAVETGTRAGQSVRSRPGFHSGVEIAFWLRPVIYAYLLKKFGDKSWLPFGVSLALDVCVLAVQSQDSTTRFTHLELDEQRRRLWLLGYYLLRNPLYDLYTKHRLLGVCKTMSRVPVVSIFSGILEQYLPLWDRVYFYTSGS
jgi:peroxin-16